MSLKELILGTTMVASLALASCSSSKNVAFDVRGYYDSPFAIRESELVKESKSKRYEKSTSVYGSNRNTESKTTPLKKAELAYKVLGNYEQNKGLYNQQREKDFEGTSNLFPISLEKFALDTLPKSVNDQFYERILYTVMKEEEVSISKLLADTTETRELSRKKALYYVKLLNESLEREVSTYGK